MDNNIYIFLYITFITSLSTVNLTTNLSEPNLSEPTSGISYVAIALTVSLFWEPLSIL